MSMIAIDYVRGFVDKSRLGTATGFVNIGGFLATFTMMFFAGVILDTVKSLNERAGIPSDLYSLEGFRWAMTVQLLILLVGTIMFLLERKHARAKLFLDEGIVLRPMRVVLTDRLRKR
jgi:sugar phosphate permease